MSNDELALLLKDYGLEHLEKKCRDLKFSLRAVLSLDEGALGLLTEFPGEKILPRSLIRDKRKNATGCAESGGSSSASASSSNGGSTGSGSSGSSGSSGGSGGSSSSGTTDSTTPLSRPGKRLRADPPAAAAASKLQKFDEAAKLRELSLADLLNEDECGGKHILEGYTASVQAYHDDEDDDLDAPILSESQRDKITEVVVRFLLKLTQNPDHKFFPILTQKIVQLFPCESEDTYYVAPRSQNPNQIHPKGKIPNRLRNEKHRRNLLKRFNPLSEPSSSSPACQQHTSGNLEKLLRTAVTEEVRAAARWLANGRSPWPLVISKWKLTAPLRLRMVFADNDDVFINNYINEFTILAHKSGHELILEDFKLLREEAASKLLENWNVFVRKLFAIASRDVKDKSIKQLVAEAKVIPQTSVNQNKLASIILEILPHIRPNHFFMEKNQQVKATVDIVKNSYLLTVEKETDIVQALKARREALSTGSGGGQPLIVLVKTEARITSVHVSVATLRFKLDSVVEAIDVFFKCFHVLHINYPPQSRHILTFLQLAVYDFRTQWDADVQHSWIKACKC
ncbi:hypothetical protein ONE63_003444 [Megalurothrips usitatus]|uniref:Uncharacterized protein n=1 Tax=Megalurothrips usitatus TaxID=439358 RepID=A0AAV7XB14_9NEOP|nr:hypothetical protein ONE63_003444 [Megalurothrips usitatus]